MLSRIEHFALFTDDLETLRAFYQGAFGLRVVVDNSKAPVPGYFLADDGGGVLEIIGRPASTSAVDTRYVCHVAFTVENYAEARAALDRLGVRFERDTEIDNESMKTAFFNDPAGNRCQIVWRARPLGAV